jgi:class 3 adenylate cyclase
MNLELAQRRLAAILAAGVVGYSRMMRSHETGTLAQLNTLRDGARRGGRGLP